jgi:intein/homing endonuclease
MRVKVDEDKLEVVCWTDDPVGPHVEYNCFFSEKIKVLTKEGIKKIKYIKKGDEVLTHKKRWRKVTEKIVNNLNKQSVERITINTKKNKITVTGNHPILIQYDGIFIWKLARDLKKGDFIVEID